MKVLLVDDHQIVIDGLRAILEEAPEIEVVGEARDGKAAIQLVRALSPDLVLLDIDMPVMNGIATLPEIKAISPTTKVIILSLHAEPVVIRKLITMQVDGYLLKTAGAEEMLQAIRQVNNGEPYFADDVTMALKKPKTIVRPGNTSSEQLSQLTDRELEILRALASGLSSKEIGEQLFISSRTVDTHRTNMMKKLGLSKVTGLIRLAIRSGIVDE